MASLPQVARSLQAVLTDLPEPLARTSGFCRRRSKLTARIFVQTLVLGWWQQPAATLGQLCHLALLRGVAITPQGLDQRFTEGGATLLKSCRDAVVRHVLTTRPIAGGRLDRFPAVYLLDSTTIALPDALAAIWPGCGGRSGPWCWWAGPCW